MYLNGFDLDQNLGPGEWGRAKRKRTMGSDGVRMKSGCSSTCCVSLFSFHLYFTFPRRGTKLKNSIWLKTIVAAQGFSRSTSPKL